MGDTRPWAWARTGVVDLRGGIDLSDPETQHLLPGLTERLAALGMRESIGTVGDAYDGTLAASAVRRGNSELRDAPSADRAAKPSR